MKEGQASVAFLVTQKRFLLLFALSAGGRKENQLALPFILLGKVQKPSSTRLVDAVNRYHVRDATEDVEDMLCDVARAIVLLTELSFFAERIMSIPIILVALRTTVPGSDNPNERVSVWCVFTSFTYLRSVFVTMSASVRT